MLSNRGTLCGAVTEPIPLAAMSPAEHVGIQAVMITRDAISAISAMAEAAAPDEGCAFLVAESGRIIDVRPTANTHPEKATRYTVDPLSYMAIEDALEGTTRALVGIVHSHPFTHAVPSVTDRAHALPGWWYLIEGHPRGKPVELRAWRLASPDGAFVEHPLRIV